MAFTNSLEANTQLIPIPPPAPDVKKDSNGDKVKNDNKPPQIQILTTELRQGKNVIKVEITDESSIELREAKYVHDGKIRSTGLVKDQGNIYKALITVNPPSAVIVINAGDTYGNEATVANLLSVTLPSDILSQIWSFFNNIFRTLGILI